MKGKKLLFGMLPLSAAMILAACNPSVPASSSSNPASEETPSSEIVTPTPTSSETSKEEVTHRGGLNKTLAEGAVTRDYDERFDKTIEDFSGESLNGVSDATRHNAFLREVVDSNLPDFQNSPDAAIFKMAAGAFDGDKTLLGSSIVHLSMRVREGKLPLKDLVFAIRPSDDNSAHVFEINLAEAVNEDGDKNPELTNEFQDITIDVGNSIDDATTTFPGTTLKVLENAVGFHLYVKKEAEVSAVIEMEKVSTKKGDTETVFDTFDRPNLSKSDMVYWGPTDNPNSVFVRKGLLIGKDKKYTTPTLMEEQRKSHVVFSVLGDMSQSKVSVVYDDAGNTTKMLPFAELKAQEDKAVVNAIDGAYTNLAIDLSKFTGPEGANVKTITLENAGDNELQLSNVFMTSFEMPDLVKKYPTFNTKTAVTFDNFNREYAKMPSGADGYTASTTDERNVSAGINGMTSWSNADNISMTGGTLNLPATEGYNEVSIDSSHVLPGAQYIVFSIKADDDADLNSFRFAMGGKTVWFNAALAMEGVKTYKDPVYETPYTTEDGFKWYVVDLKQHEINSTGSIEIYYTGAKDIKLDSVFLANGFSAVHGRKGDLDLANLNEAELDLAGYHYIGGVGPSVNARYGAVTMKGDGTATLATFRASYNDDDAKWIKDSAIDVYTEDGRKVTKDEVIPDTYATYYVDLESVSYAKTGTGWFKAHIGGEGATGKINIKEIFMASQGYAKDLGSKEIVSNGSYVGEVVSESLPFDASMMILHVTGDEGTTLKDWRFTLEKDGKVDEAWPSGNPGLLKVMWGDAFDFENTAIGSGLDLIVDLSALPKEKQSTAGKLLKYHIGGGVGANGKKIQIETKLVAKETPSNMALADYSQLWTK